MQMTLTRNSKFAVVLLLAAASLLLFFLQPVSAWAASMSLAPSTGVYTAGEVFTTRVVVNTDGSAINAAEATLSFNPRELSVVSVQKGATFTLWAVEPSFSNTAGTINFGGGSPQGYTGSAGTVLTITWRSRGAGTSRVTFANGSVLAADGRGTNILQNLNGGSYTIATAAIQPEPEMIEYVAPANTPGRPSISSDTHPADGWSPETTATLSWTLPVGVTAVRTLLNGNPSSVPTNVYEPPISSMTLDELEEGVQYFHLQFRNADGWGQVAHYRLAIDTEPPTAFTIERTDTWTDTSPTQELRFEVTDATSPVVRYVVRHNDREPYEYIDETGSSTMMVTDLAPGPHDFVIEAFDSAGNSRIATFSLFVEAFAAPVWTEFPAAVRPSVVPVFFGETRPNAQVAVEIIPVGGGVQGTVPMQYAVTADAEGIFRVVPDGRLAEGVYEVIAIATDEFGSQSAKSEPARFSVTAPGYVSFGQFAVSVMSILVPLIALLILTVLVVVYGITHLRRIRTVVRRETTDALAVLDKEFAQLRETVAADVSTLKNARKSKELTKAEASLVENLTNQLETTYTTLKREIAEVDDIVEK
jgi:hypothetical protein